MPSSGDTERTSWDCTRCQRNRADAARNCGGKFPNSGVGQRGYEVSDFKIFECPKTFIKAWSLDFIRFCDSSRDLGHNLFPTLADLPNRFVQLWQIVEIEKAKSQTSRRQIEDAKGNSWPPLKK